VVAAKSSKLSGDSKLKNRYSYCQVDHGYKRKGKALSAEPTALYSGSTAEVKRKAYNYAKMNTLKTLPLGDIPNIPRKGRGNCHVGQANGHPCSATAMRNESKLYWLAYGLNADSQIGADSNPQTLCYIRMVKTKGYALPCK